MRIARGRLKRELIFHETHTCSNDGLFNMPFVTNTGNWTIRCPRDVRESKPTQMPNATASSFDLFEFPGRVSKPCNPTEGTWVRHDERRLDFQVLVGFAAAHIKEAVEERC